MMDNIVMVKDGYHVVAFKHTPDHEGGFESEMVELAEALEFRTASARIPEASALKPLEWVPGHYSTRDDDNGPEEGEPRRLFAWRACDYIIIKQDSENGLYVIKGLEPGTTTVVASLEAAKAVVWAHHKQRIRDSLIPSEQCFTVREGCEVLSYERREVMALSGSTKQGLVGVPLNDALTIRPAEEVRREALKEAATYVNGVFAGERPELVKAIRAMGRTPAPSPDTQMDICRYCNGSGESVADQMCPVCDGSGGENTQPNAAPSTDTTPSVAEAAKEWHLGSMNDGLFIIDARPQPSNDHVCHDRPDGPDLVIPVHGLTDKQAQEIVDAHNTALRALASQTGEDQ